MAASTSLFLFLLLGISATCKTQDCDGLKSSYAEDKKATWYPPKCTDAKVPVGTKCYLMCKDDYVFSAGAHIEMECVKTSLGEYMFVSDYNPLMSCKGTPCPPLEIGNANNIDIVPSECSKPEVSSSTQCATYCSGSEKFVGNKVRDCMINGTYSPRGGGYCMSKPPIIKVTCPKRKVEISTDPGKKTADAIGMFERPNGIFDESRLELVIDNANKDFHALPIGIHSLSYTIYDPAGQEPQKCPFELEVKDMEPPYGELCPEELEYVVETRKVVKIEKFSYSFQDAVDGKVSANYVNFNKGVGEYQHLIRAEDRSGNKASCSIKIRVRDGGSCTTKYPPENGEITAVQRPVYPGDYGYATNCTPGMHKICLLSVVDVMMCYLLVPCTHGFLLDAPLPSCAAFVDKVNDSCPIGTEVFQSSCIPCLRSTFYNSTSKRCELCPDNSTSYNIPSYKCTPCPIGTMTKHRRAPRFCENICKDGYAFDVSSKTCTKCGANMFLDSNGTSCMHCSADTVTIKDIATKPEDCVFGKVVTASTGTVDLGTQDSLKYENWTLRFNPSNLSSNPLYQRLRLLVKSDQLSKETDCSQSYLQVTGLYKGLTTELTGKLCGNALKEPFTVVLRPWRSNYVQYKWKTGTTPDISITYGLAECRRGHYYNITTFSCMPCPVQTYQNETGKSFCKPCPPGKAAVVKGSYMCKDGCLPGFFRKGLFCHLCPIGTYSESRESSSCEKCGNGFSTAYLGTDSRQKCLAGPCKKGEYKSLLGNCTLCPPGSYQDYPRHATRLCKYCPDGKTTRDKGSVSLNDCIRACKYEGEFYNASSKMCEKCPIGSYRYASWNIPLACTSCPQNYTTKRKGAVSKYECVKFENFNCKPNPCKFPGRCVDTGPTFQCICPSKFGGSLCEIDLHRCVQNPCLNNGTCFNKGSSDFFCDCKPGWTGKRCENKYYPCNSNPCYNGGNCSDVGNNYYCTCAPYFTGKRCFKEMSKPCHLKPCGKYGACTNGPYPGAIPSYTCSCFYDFTGKNCETSFDACASNPCNPIGSVECRDTLTMYICVCKSGYIGDFCNVTKHCNPGHYFETRCKKCPIGSYQPEKKETYNCITCPSGQTTLRVATEYASGCLNLPALVKVKGSLKFTTLAWHSGLLDTKSKFFIDTANFVEAQIKMVYAGDRKLIDVVVQSFRKGSVFSDFVIYFDSDTKDAERKLQLKAEAGTVGNLTVDPQIWKLETTIPPKTGEKSKTVLIIVIVLVVIFIIAIVIGVFLWYKKCRKERGLNKIEQKSYFTNKERVEFR